MTRIQFYLNDLKKEDKLNPPPLALFLTFIPVCIYSAIICATFSIIASTHTGLLITFGSILVFLEILGGSCNINITSSIVEFPLVTLFVLPFSSRMLSFKEDIISYILLGVIAFLVWLPALISVSSVDTFPDIENNRAIFLCAGDQYSSVSRPGFYPFDQNGNILYGEEICFIGSKCKDLVRVCGQNEKVAEMYITFIAPILTLSFVILVPFLAIWRNKIVEIQVKKMETNQEDIELNSRK